MTDLNKYEELNGIELRPEVARLMELFAECWDECRAQSCSECKFIHGKKHYRILLCMSERYAEKLIANDVAPVRHGRWEQCFEDWRKQIEGNKCSLCGFEHYGTSIRDYLYCPNCGAKMDGENNGEQV